MPFALSAETQQRPRPDPGLNQAKQHSRLISLLRVKQTLTRLKRSVFLESAAIRLSDNMSAQQRFDKALYAIKKILVRESSIEKKLTFREFYKQSAKRERCNPGPFGCFETSLQVLERTVEVTQVTL